MAQRIEDYAIVGNTQTVAMVGRNGSIDWLCMPRFDAGACFAALLGDKENGSWLLTPEAPVKTVRRHYRGDTLVLETEFELAGGERVALIDFMPVMEEDGRVDLVRIVEGRGGSVPMRMDMALRFDYGRIVPWVRRRDYGLSAIAGPDAMQCRTPVEMRGEGFRTVANFTITDRERIPFTMTWYRSHLNEPAAREPFRMLDETHEWWRKWSAQCTHKGRWRKQVMRSLITLKALTYSPTGGIIAAATTSLPEKIGGVRNWDYRFCWLRDATFTLYALLASGYTEEAVAWRQWLLRSIAGQPEELQIMYGLAGERRLTESELPWLKGYEDSRPVRLGNAAHGQFQLDVYGEIMDAFYASRAHLVEPGGEDAWRVQTLLMNFLESHWNEPDEGIWEVRGPRRHFTHSRVMAWVAADRAVKIVERYGADGPVDKWRKLRDAIHKDVCDHGFDPKRNAFVQYYGAQGLDAALLMIPLVGFLPPKDPRVIATVEAIQRELMMDGLVRRYGGDSTVDGLPPGEGAFLPCTFWLADNLHMLDRHEEANEVFERLIGLCNDVGLLSEEYDSVLHRQVGNFPQAFSHVALVNSANNLTQAEGPARNRAKH
ncbi:MAG: glycoside hydrolase family 15 protein [Candidatus Binataceae bacterium]